MVQHRRYHRIRDFHRLNQVQQVYESQNVTYDNLTITGASANANRARNTDGWNIYRSDTVVIKNSVIVNGDDCVAFKPSEFAHDLGSTY